MKSFFSCLLLALLSFVARPTFAAEGGTSLAPIEHRLAHETIIGLRYNPVGLALKTTAEYRYRLYESESKLFQLNYIAPGLQLNINPANVKIGPRVAIHPLSVLQLFAGYYYLGYFGSFDRVQTFDSLASDFSDDTLKANGEAGLNYAASGSILSVGAKVQLKVGPVAVVSTQEFQKLDLETQDNDPLFYESEWDMLMPADGWAYKIDNDLLYITDFGLLAGVRHTYTTAYYDSALVQGSPGGINPQKPNHRVGPFLAWRFFTDAAEKRTFFNEPTLVLLVNWYLEHTYRTGAASSQALPYAALAFRFAGDILDID